MSFSQDNKIYTEQNLSIESSFSTTKLLILGTFHFLQHDFKKYPQNFESLKERLLEYRPEVICVEWLPPSEKNDIYNREYTNIINLVVRKVAPSKKQDLANIEELLKKIQPGPDNLLLQARIVYHLYITRDYVNAWYYKYLLDSFTGELTLDIQNQIKDILPASIMKHLNKFNGHEIEKLLFPIAKQLGVKRLCPIDYIGDVKAQNEYYKKFSEKLVEKQKYNPLTEMADKIQKPIDDWFTEDKKNGTSLCFEKINSGDFIRKVHNIHMNAYFSFFYDKNFQLLYELNIERRNWKIYNLILEAIKANIGKKTLVLIGLSHKPFLERYFKDFNKVELIQMSDL